MGQVWHVPETGGLPGIEPGFYCKDEAALAALLADPTTEHASVPSGEPSPFVHGQRARVATPEQAEILRWHESRPSPSEAGAKLRAMSDEDAPEHALHTWSQSHFDPKDAAQVLRDAGFVRAQVLIEALVHGERAIADFRVISMRPLYGAPRLSSDLQRIRDLLAGRARRGGRCPPQDVRGRLLDRRRDLGPPALDGGRGVRQATRERGEEGIVMKRALYLRPAAVDMTGLDGALRAWLRSEGIEPVEAAPYDLVAYLPYNDGGDYYRADVSPGMATALVEAIGGGIEVRRIRLRETVTTWAGEPKRENDYRVLESADLAWEPDGYGGRPTLAIMTPGEVEGAGRVIEAESQLSWHDLCAVWSPPPPKPARALGMPFLRASVDKVTYGFTAARDELVPLIGGPLTRLFKGLVDEQTMALDQVSLDPGDKLPILQERSAGLSQAGQSLIRNWAEAAIASGELQMPDGMTVDEFVSGMTVISVGDVCLCPGQDVEVTTHTDQVTFHPDGSYSRRLR